MFNEFDKYERMVKSALMRGGIKEEQIDMVAVMTENDLFVVIAFTKDGLEYPTVKWSMPLIGGNSDITSDDGRVISAKEEMDEDNREYEERFKQIIHESMKKAEKTNNLQSKKNS